MKGIYITAEGKAELEAEKERCINLSNSPNRARDRRTALLSKIRTIEQILESSTVLPVEESWENNGVISIEKKWLFINYPQGVIIKPKKP